MTNGPFWCIIENIVSCNLFLIMYLGPLYLSLNIQVRLHFITPWLKNSSKEGLNTLIQPYYFRKKLVSKRLLGHYVYRSQILNRIDHIHILKQNHLFGPFIFFQGLNRRIPPLKHLKSCSQDINSNIRLNGCVLFDPMTLLVSWINEQALHFNLQISNCQK